MLQYERDYGFMCMNSKSKANGLRQTEPNTNTLIDGKNACKNPQWLLSDYVPKKPLKNCSDDEGRWTPTQII